MTEEEFFVQEIAAYRVEDVKARWMKIAKEWVLCPKYYYLDWSMFAKNKSKHIFDTAQAAVSFIQTVQKDHAGEPFIVVYHKEGGNPYKAVIGGYIQY